MSKKSHRRRAPLTPHRKALPGASPGTLHIDPAATPSRIHVMAYDAEKLVEKEIADPAALQPYLNKWAVTWINVNGLGDESMLRALAKIFGIHPLALEDVVNVNQRPKAEHYQQHDFIVLRMATHTEHLHLEQISIFLGRNYVLTFQEHAGDCLDPVRERIRMSRGRIRGAGADYLAYALVDSIADHYFPVLDEYAETMERVEQSVIEATAEAMQQLMEIKHDILVLRRMALPLRDTLILLAREERPLVSAETRVYLRDAADHAVRIVDGVEALREMATSLVNIYMSSVSIRMNDIMRVLAIIATVFIPLTFIAGLYGMNFKGEKSPLNMPELDWYWGYPAALGLMALIAISLLFYFRRKGWIGKNSVARRPNSLLKPPKP